MSLSLLNSIHLFALYKIVVISFKQFFVLLLNIFASITFLFSRLRTGKIDFSKINFPTNEFFKYFGNKGNFLEINK